MRLLCCEVAQLHLDDTLYHSLNDTINRPLNGPHDHLITSYCDIEGKVIGMIKVAISACLLVEQYETAERSAEKLVN